MEKIEKLISGVGVGGELFFGTGEQVSPKVY